MGREDIFKNICRNYLSKAWNKGQRHAKYTKTAHCLSGGPRLKKSHLQFSFFCHSFGVVFPKRLIFKSSGGCFLRKFSFSVFQWASMINVGDFYSSSYIFKSIRKKPFCWEFSLSSIIWCPPVLPVICLATVITKSLIVINFQNFPCSNFQWICSNFSPATICLIKPPSTQSHSFSSHIILQNTWGCVGAPNVPKIMALPKLCWQWNYQC